MSTDCEKFIELIDLLLDNEADPDEQKYIADHVDICGKCLEKLELQKQFKELISTRIESKKVPEGLADSIRSKIKSLA